MSRFWLGPILLLFVGGARAQVASVQVDASGSVVSQAAYRAGTLSVSLATPLDVVVVNEAGSSAVFGAVTFDLNTFLDTVFIDPGDGKVKGRFVGGQVALEFKDVLGAPYELSGPVGATVVDVEDSSPGSTTLGASGIFQAAVANLPANPTGIWPQTPPAWSLFRGLMLETSDDLGFEFAWDSDWTGVAVGLWEFVPVVPEPGLVGVLVICAVAVVRKR